MAKYAENTKVSRSRSIEEVERNLARYGADGFFYGWEGNSAHLGFSLNGRMIKMVVSLPDRKGAEFWTTETGRDRKPEAAHKAWEAATRQRWRALSLVVKAKLEAVESGISTIEQEFLAHLVLPNGQTVGSWAAPQLEAAYETGTMPKLLPGA